MHFCCFSHGLTWDLLYHFLLSLDFVCKSVYTCTTHTLYTHCTTYNSQEHSQMLWWNTLLGTFFAKQHAFCLKKWSSHVTCWFNSHLQLLEAVAAAADVPYEMSTCRSIQKFLPDFASVLSNYVKSYEMIQSASLRHIKSQCRDFIYSIHLHILTHNNTPGISWRGWNPQKLISLGT